MSLKDARRTALIKELLTGRSTNRQTAGLLDLSVRQVQRLKAEAAAHGVAAILHAGRGRKPPNVLDPVLAETIVATYRDELFGYNFCHAADVLAEEKGIRISVRTLSRYLHAAGIPSPKSRRRPSTTDPESPGLEKVSLSRWMRPATTGLVTALTTISTEPSTTRRIRLSPFTWPRRRPSKPMLSSCSR